ncbi:MAG: hypothetical protein M1449_13570 [Candidatus Thermoplasmatota archaeon]|nr:hypothetical protein [Candidatus Thermoplasmatota archaeon]
MKNRLSAFLAVAALAGLSGCETHPYYGDVRMHDRDYDVRVVFSDRDRPIIRDYYRGYYRSLPPGLAKQGKIPPGHAFRMQRHQAIPPGVTWDHLPADVERRLSRLPDGYVRVVIGADVAILHTRTRVVLDVIEPPRD